MGTAVGMSLARRAQLAVVAHIRHTYTNYDYLLKAVNVNWNDARRLVENNTLDRLVSWRGDGNEDTNAMQDIIREVIVISDDEDDVHSNTDDDGMLCHEQTIQDSMVEAISPGRPQRHCITPAPPGNSFLGRARTRQYNDHAISPSGRGSQHDQRKIERNQTLWHRAWEDALARREKDPEILKNSDGPLDFRESDTMEHATKPNYESQARTRHENSQLRSNLVPIESRAAEDSMIKAKPLRQVSI